MATYAAGVVILKFVDEDQIPQRKWTVTGYKGGSEVNKVEDITDINVREATLTTYQKEAKEKQIYDMVTLTEYNLTIPS